jgi:RNA polymerase sigma factor (sigma-70 family)
VKTNVRRDALEAALGRVADGDRAALKEVYDLTAARLLGVIVQIARDREHAEDVLQDVYLKIWHRAGRFDRERASPMTWLYAIARNAAIDWLRKHGRSQEFTVDTFPDRPDDAPSAEEVLCDHQDHERLRGCIEELQNNQQSSIRLAYYGGLTYSELAEQVGVPLGTMKSWIRRGLASLKKCLSDG